MADVTVKVSFSKGVRQILGLSKANKSQTGSASPKHTDSLIDVQVTCGVNCVISPNPCLTSPPAAAALTEPPVAVPRVASLGWKPLRSEIVRPLAFAPPSVVAVTPTDVSFGQFAGAILQTFFWPVPPPDANSLLVRSLSHALSAYPTFCGRFLESCEIDINNDGVLVEFGECAATLADVLPSRHEHQIFEPLDLSQFNPMGARLLTNVIAERQPLLTFFIGTLADGALVVMVNFSHAVADAHSVRQLMRDWTATARAMLAGQTPAVPVPYEYGRAWYDKLVASAPAASEPQAPFNADVSPPGSAWVRVPFEVRPPGAPPLGTPVILYVSKERLAELKAEATRQLEGDAAKQLEGEAAKQLEGEAAKQLEGEAAKQLEVVAGGVGFISTYDALISRLRQVMAGVPGRGASRATVTAMALDLRGRVRLAGQPGTELLCQETAVGNIIRAAQGELLDDPAVAGLVALASASRACINRTNAAMLDEAVWATRVERERGLPSFLEYMIGKLDLFGPFPDFILSKWDYTADELDFGSGPAVWIQGGTSVPELGLAVPALLPGTEGGMFVNLAVREELLAAFKAMPYPI